MFLRVRIHLTRDKTSPWVAGISGSSHGAYSIALSGGYADDVDLGYAL
jgi:E3 ubiquitin-protein ligase UHRF1